MNTFKQDNLTNLIGSKEEIAVLAQKEKAKVLVVSDSHGNSAVLKSIVEHSGSECDAMIFCGDGIGDIVALTEIAEKVPPVLGMIEGNGDPDSYFFNEELVHVPLNCSMTAAGHNIFFTHGHRFSLYEGLDEIKEVAESIECKTIFFGHTHVSFSALTEGNVFVLNPGSCARPRQGQPPSFAVVTFEKNRENCDAVFYQAVPGNIIPFVPEINFY